MTTPDEIGPGERALADLVAELTEIARPPAHCDPVVLGRLNTAFGRVRDLAPDVHRSDPSISGFHFETDYFADSSIDRLDLADTGDGAGDG